VRTVPAVVGAIEWMDLRSTSEVIASGFRFSAKSRLSKRESRFSCCDYSMNVARTFTGDAWSFDACAGKFVLRFKPQRIEAALFP
jgi:hypothetical protein